MKLFVFDDVLIDYTGGICIIAANTLKEAEQIAKAEYPWDYTNNTAWKTPAAVYNLADNINSGVLHVVLGGS